MPDRAASAADGHLTASYAISIAGINVGLLLIFARTTRGDDCDVLALKDDYLAYRNAHMRMTNEWQARPD